jgi:hypothetical protein
MSGYGNFQMGKIYKHILCVRTTNGAVNVSNGRKDIQENRRHPFFLEIHFNPSLGNGNHISAPHG